MPLDAFDPTSTYLLLREDGAAERLEVDERFWPDVIAERRRLDGRLVSGFRLERDVDHWEIHPAGDEVLVRLSGRFEVVLERDGAERIVALDAAAPCCVIPAGAWHAIRVREAGVVVFLTPGEGTQHRPA
jgi:mannose-6-phosphate isomerase-like protein (cupin superfamily)